MTGWPVTQSAWTRLDHSARGLFPFTLTLLLIMLGVVPFSVPGLSPIMPAFALIAVYYWTIYRPDLMPPWAIFLIGLATDLLGGGPLGVGVFVLLVVYATVAAQRRVFASGNFLLVWALFLPIAAGALALSWIFSCLILDSLIDPRPAVFRYLTTVATYPCLAWLFGQAQRAVLR